MSDVKNQGSCGSCWTFSTAGTFESHYALVTGKVGAERQLFSEQQLVDCAGDFENNGCSGGLPSHAFQYIYYKGFQSAGSYAYTGKDEVCKFDKTKVVGGTLGSYNITEGDELSMKQAIAKVGPVAISYRVIEGFKNYKEGVYSAPVCANGPMDVNHAVQGVGYGTEDGKDYWLIKNSWGTTFGMEGYFKMERGVNMCGVAVCNSFPVGVHTLQ